MSAHLIPGRALAAVAVTEPPDVPAIRAALHDILESKHFRTSKQCSDLLQYIVEHSFSAEAAPLKERIIGMEVFGRAPTYDTAEDPVVRVRAADVRKRLAQYYQGADRNPVPLHIELLPGSYRVSFRREQLPPPPTFELVSTPVEAPVPFRAEPLVQPLRKSLVWPVLVAISLIAVGIAALSWFLWAPKSPQASFWEPLTKTKQPVLIYLGSNAAYTFTTQYLDQYRAAHGLTNNGPEFFVTLPPNSSIPFNAIVPVPDTFVTVGDLAATVQMGTLMDSWKTPFVMRSGRDVAFGDLRNRPSVLIGGFNNHWTLEVTSDLPYSFRQGTQIVDRRHPDRVWSVPVNGGSTTEDYAIISRLLQSKTGGPVVIVAGIGECGTQAAAEFLSSPEKMKKLLKSAPRGWEEQNMQAVLRIKVVGYAPVGTEVVATSYW